MQQQQQTALVVPQDALDAQPMNREHWEIVDMQTSAKDKAADLVFTNPTTGQAPSSIFAVLDALDYPRRL